MNFATDVLRVAFGLRVELGNAGVRYMIAAPAAQVGGQAVGAKWRRLISAVAAG